MSEGYVKLLSSIVRSSIWGEPDHVRVLWITMMAIADKHGCVYASIDGLAHEARKTIDETEDALRRFMAPDPRSRTKDHDGRRVIEIDGGWQLLSYERIRGMHGEEAEKARKRDWWNSNRGKKTSSQSRLDAASELDASPSSLDNSRASNGSASASDLNHSDPERSSFLSASPKDLSGTQGEPSIQEYCQGLEANRYDAAYEPVQKRPEIIAAAAAFWAALKLSPQPLGSYGSDRGVVALCRLYAAGFTQEQLVEACQAAPGDAYFADKKHRGLSSLTLEVVRRLLAAKQSTTTNAAPATRKRDELSEAERKQILESRAQLELANRQRGSGKAPLASSRTGSATPLADMPENGVSGSTSRELGSVVSTLAERLG